MRSIEKRSDSNEWAWSWLSDASRGETPQSAVVSLGWIQRTIDVRGVVWLLDELWGPMSASEIQDPWQSH